MYPKRAGWGVAKKMEIEDINKSIQDTKDNVEQSGFITRK